jgi:colanic acid/amylovoran biosynthesis glycosyltransferase
MEAMAAGLPVVSSRLSGIPELVGHEVSGLLTEPGDVDALAGCLQRLAAEPATRAAFGRAGRQRVVEDFDVRRNAERLLDLVATATR